MTRRLNRRPLATGPVRVLLFLVALLQIFTLAFGRLAAFVARVLWRLATAPKAEPRIAVMGRPIMVTRRPRRSDSTRRRLALVGSK